MDIHKPKPWSGWREFLKEYAIIVAGVLTALAAEQAVQRLEWAHKVHAAEDAMRAELLFDDGPQVYQRAVIEPCVTASLDAIRAGVEAGASRAEMVRLIQGFVIDFYSFDTLAHEDATHAGVADHMAPARLALWTTAYSMMAYMERTNAEEAKGMAQLRALSHAGGPLSEAERTQVLNAVEFLRLQDFQMIRGARWTLPAIRRLGALDPVRMKTFMDRARAWYPGGCVAELPADWPLGTPDTERTLRAHP
jgi:hypothetical protein